MEGKERPHKGGGSRYLYEPFQSGVELAPMLKLEALERVQAFG